MIGTLAKAIEYRTDWQDIAASSTGVQLVGQSGKGGQGDVVDKVIVQVTTAASSTVTLTDTGGNSITLSPANMPIGLYNLQLGVASAKGAWTITTGAGAKCTVVGRFQ